MVFNVGMMDEVETLVVTIFIGLVVSDVVVEIDLVDEEEEPEEVIVGDDDELLVRFV